VPEERVNCEPTEDGDGHVTQGDDFLVQHDELLVFLQVRGVCSHDAHAHTQTEETLSHGCAPQVRFVEQTVEGPVAELLLDTVASVVKSEPTDGEDNKQNHRDWHRELDHLTDYFDSAADCAPAGQEGYCRPDDVPAHDGVVGRVILQDGVLEEARVDHGARAVVHLAGERPRVLQDPNQDV